MRGLPLPDVRRLASGASASTRTAVAFVQAVRAASTYKRYRAPKPELTKFAEGHGEQIWVFNHLSTNQVVYSHTPVLRNNRALRQLPFNGKNTKPVKLRKDYWKPMALIQFEEGAGVVGRSAFQKLREFRREHELSWGHQAPALHGLRDQLAHDREVALLHNRERRQLSKRVLGAALNDQRANSIADMAAVLAGAGRGNLVMQKQKADGASGEAAVAVTPAKLAPATVFWANEFDRNLAESWSDNVVHAAGIPERASAPNEYDEAESAEPSEA